MTNTNEGIVEKKYKTKMSSSSQGSTGGNKIIEQQHTHSEIISHADELLAKELSQSLATLAELKDAYFGAS